MSRLTAREEKGGQRWLCWEQRPAFAFLLLLLLNFTSSFVLSPKGRSLTVHWAVETQENVMIEVIPNPILMTGEAEESGEDNTGEELDHNAVVRQKAANSLVLSKKNNSPRSKQRPQRHDNVGGGRIKSSGGASETTQLVNAVKQKAKTSTKQSDGGAKKKTMSHVCHTTTNKTPKKVQDSIDNLLERHAGMDTYKRWIPLGGLKAKPAEIAASHPLLRNPPPGTTLLQHPNRLVRTATIFDDDVISSLRLSVFTDLEATPDMRKQFIVRSRQVLSNRRLRGATCLVVYDDQQTTLASVECSVHEFYGTKLGKRRPRGSVLYITEVAVNPKHRRSGLGTLLLQAIDELAQRRGDVESLYLHVDVANEAALRLYEKCGYVVTNANEMYAEFTSSLNLHDGATRGRNHYLLVKHLSEPTWLVDQQPRVTEHARIGFEIPA